MNKKFIEFVEKHTDWEWFEKGSLREEYPLFMITEGSTVMHTAKPEDLLGWKMQFAEKCGHPIGIFWAEKKNGYIWISHVLGYKEYFEAKTYQEAFDAAWEKFIELIEA